MDYRAIDRLAVQTPDAQWPIASTIQSDMRESLPELRVAYHNAPDAVLECLRGHLSATGRGDVPTANA